MNDKIFYYSAIIIINNKFRMRPFNLHKNFTETYSLKIVHLCNGLFLGNNLKYYTTSIQLPVKHFADNIDWHINLICYTRMH